MSQIELTRLGWSSHFANQLSTPNDTEAAELAPFRVCTRQRDRFQLRGANESRWASARGRLFEEGALPAVGDWVLATTRDDGDSVIETVLKRKSQLIRQAAGKRTEAQIIAANLDIVFVVCSANSELNLRRLERYLTAVWDGGAKPVILVNKADLSERNTIEQQLEELGDIAPVAITSAIDGDVEAARAHLCASPPTTAAFVGSSGVGKSTLINALFGTNIQATGEIREDDDKGRHTTTARELLVSEDIGILIDTPGMRELALWEGDSGVASAFAEIEEHAARCKFRDCNHGSEPGCGVKAAIADGSISEKRFASYVKLTQEIAHHERDRGAAGRHAERLANRKRSLMIKTVKRIKPD